MSDVMDAGDLRDEIGNEPYHWASMLDKDEPTLSDLATGSDELAIPLGACREVLVKIGDGEMGDPPQFIPSLAIALVALMDKLESKRERLTGHLYRLAGPERRVTKDQT